MIWLAGRPIGPAPIPASQFSASGELQMLGNFIARLRNGAATTFAPLIALIVTLGLGLYLFDAGTKLHPPAISLQKVWNSETAASIVQSWTNAKETDKATAQVYWDFLFIVAYAYLLFAFGSAAARDARNRTMPRLAKIAGCAAVAGLLAGCFDVAENIGLLTMIGRTTAQPLPFLTSLASSAKFALIAVSYLGSVAALLWPVRQTAV
jgi:hypothetical protein